MKQLSIIALTLVLTVSLCACGRRNNTPATEPEIMPSTVAPTVVPSAPEMDPTLDTNIPDANVDPVQPNGTNNGTSDPATGNNDTNNGTSGPATGNNGTNNGSTENNDSTRNRGPRSRVR